MLITTTGDQRIAKRFSKLAHNAGSMEKAFTEIAEALALANKRSWGRGVKLAEATIEQKQAMGLPDEPLVRTGKLKASLTEPDAGDGIRRITPHEMVFGTKAFYARFINYGTTHQQKHKVLKFGVGTRKLTKELLRRHLMS